MCGKRKFNSTSNPRGNNTVHRLVFYMYKHEHFSPRIDVRSPKLSLSVSAKSSSWKSYQTGSIKCLTHDTLPPKMRNVITIKNNSSVEKYVPGLKPSNV